MSLKTFITDPITNYKAQVNDDNGKEDRGLVVATRELKQFINRVEFFFNPTYGIDMNVSPTTGGTDINIHNGLDDTYWTATGIVGPARWDFNSSTQSHTGSYSINATTTINGDVAQFAKGSTQDLTGYDSLAGWIYITGWGQVGVKEVMAHGWDTATGQVGDSINISYYIDNTEFNSWQKFVIPLGDMDLVGATVDSFRFQTMSTGGGAAPDYFLDDILIEEEGAAVQYTIEPPHKTWLWVDQINISMADVLNTVLENASMHNLSYNKFLGLPELSVGLLFQRWHNRAVTLTVNFNNILDILQLPNTNILNIGSDGTNTWFTLNQIFASPIVLKAEEEDKLVFNVRDDMTGLLRFRVAASSRQENREERLAPGV